MDISCVPPLAEAMKEYYEGDDLLELCEMFDVEVEYDDHDRPAYMKLARKLVQQIEHGNNRRLLETLVPSLVGRAAEGVAHSSYERQEYHREMSSRIDNLVVALRDGAARFELTVPEDMPFTAKSEAREFLASAETDVLVVDNYIGAGTLDCLRDLRHPIRLMTGQHRNAIEAGFERVLEEFRSEGQTIEVRQHPRLHDRHLIFNERCWLIGSSLKDAGRKTFNIIECVDSKDMIVADIEAKWAEAAEYTV